MTSQNLKTETSLKAETNGGGFVANLRLFFKAIIAIILLDLWIFGPIRKLASRKGPFFTVRIQRTEPKPKPRSRAKAKKERKVADVITSERKGIVGWLIGSVLGIVVLIVLVVMFVIPALGALKSKVLPSTATPPPAS